MSSSGPDSPSPEPRSADRLESWKEIARYLGREVRTVQRWEKQEGLPVHRHRHTAGGSVFALRTELDAWRDQRTASEAPATPSAPSGRLGRPGWPRLIALILLVLVIGLLFQQLRPGGPGGEDAPARSRLVVLPLLDLTTSPVDEALRDGFPEEIIARLSQLEPERLAVIGRTSSMRYKERERSIAEIGAELGVTHVVEGSVRAEGSRFRVSMRLLRADREDQMWADTFDFEAGSLLGIQEEVARAVGNAVAHHLLEMAPAGSPDRARNALAHEAYLRGLYLWNKGTGDGFLRSMPFFEEALAVDPDFVDAHVGLARAHMMLGRYGLRSPEESFPPGLEAVQRALDLDPNNAEAWAARAMASFYWEWDFARADGEYRKAIALGPGLALTHHWYAHYLSAMSRHDEAIVQVGAAQSLEPLWPLVTTDAAWFFYRARRFEEAIGESRRSLQLEPDSWSALHCLVDCLQHLDRHDEAWSEMRAHLEATGALENVPGLVPDDPRASIEAVYRWQLAGLVDAQGRGVHIAPRSFVFAHAMLGNDEETFEWLARAIESRDNSALLLYVHPMFDGLREDPRYAEMVHEIGFARE